MSRVLEGIEQFLSRAGFERGPWLAVAFATGILAWFALPSVPAWTALCVGSVLVFTAALIGWKRDTANPRLRQAVLVLPILILAGCLTVWTRSVLVGEAPLGRPIAGTFTARVLAVEQQPARDRQRLIVAMREPTTGRAIKVRINVPDAPEGKPIAAGQAAPGDLVRFRGRLMPPAPPMLPGAYNFARTAWFAGIAGTGTVLRQVEIIERGRARAGWLAGVRQSLTDHIAERIGPRNAGMAAAFVTGDRGAISEADDQAMRDSGLAHLLSISGLHVSAMVGAVYVLVIRLLALWPWLALRVRLPVVAAGAGALAGVGYTLLSGAEVPTVRSCIGALLVLAALALGREPLSLRMLAFAAFCVMLLWPEAVTGPSFQMSFGAVLALVALGGSAPVRHFLSPREESMAATGLRHLALLLLTGAVIDLALMPIGLHHFHRAGVYGALANVLAIPLSTFVVMPLLAGALVLDMVGLGGPVWWLANISIDLLTGIAHWFASRPGAMTILPAAGTGAFLLFVVGGLWLGLWSGRVRLLGLIPAVAGAVLLATATPADILVSGEGRHLGLVEAGGQRLFVLRDGGKGYARDNLMELSGMEGEPVALTQWPGARCNADFCVMGITRGGRRWDVLVSRGKDAVPERALAAACERVDIVVSERWLPRSCRPRWFKADRAYLDKSGGLAIYLDKGRVNTVADTQGEHGWWQPRVLERRKPVTTGQETGSPP
ncbi:ComEC/Rec2 family competence protein [Novosphingobium sp. Leaf2]|uniref:ComEC/Rec2 family competence protein n=1 Tax=Novosphingobium sp. Leaf2 TaxID=1735670 RepID=UPI000A940D7F|nr:ComEC/Rec2 family competence protein [Novosphingobium sp. Leaf2]